MRDGPGKALLAATGRWTRAVAWYHIDVNGIREMVSSETIQRLRTERLPNETSGILQEAFDVERQLIHVVDTIPSPVDSQKRAAEDAR